MKFWRVDEPVAKKLVTVLKTEVRAPMIPVLARISVVEARPETAKFVVVAFVVVEFCAVKFCRVVELLARIFSERIFPIAAVLALKSVVEALPEIKRVVVVAFVVVELEAWKSVRVDEAVEIKPFVNTRVVEVACSPVASVRNG